jgi:beta-glucosidase-like glycosyl hydrolase
MFPHNVGLGATRDAKLVEKIGRITAEEVRATGINWVFSPCVTVPRDDRWGRAYEGFSEDPAVVAELGEAAVRGLQGTNLAAPGSVLACAKHYLADGGTVYGTGIPNSTQRTATTQRPGRHAAVRSRPRGSTRATSLRSARGSRLSCRPTAAGTARRCRATSTFSPTS